MKFEYNKLYTRKDVKTLCKSQGFNKEDARHFWNRAYKFGEGKASFTTGRLLMRAIIGKYGHGVWQARQLTGRAPFGGEYNPHEWRAEQAHWAAQSRRRKLKEGRI